MKPLVWCLCFILCVCVLTAVNLDLLLSALYYTPSVGWVYARDLPWRWLYDYGTFPAIAMAVGAAVGLIVSWGWPGWRPYRRRCAFLLLVVALGPGLLVNGILKPGWGRPRPRHVEFFGGQQPYYAWWQPAGPGAGKSFPSGHTSMGFALAAAVVLVPRRRRVWRRLWVASAFSYGCVLGWARIIQGGHFLSDTVWAGGVVGMVMWGLYVGLQPELADQPELV